MSKFAYFAYGSNLLASRIHLNNPSAVRIGIGKIENFKLDFNIQSKRWKGAAATIVPQTAPGSAVWGAIWELDLVHMATLDHQESVTDKMYFPLEVDVILPDNAGTKKCRVYQQCATISDTHDVTRLPVERQPSTVYLDIIKRGARESNLPQHYIDFLEKIPDNGYNGPVEINLNN